YLRAGRQPVPVLRKEVPDGRTEPRPCRAAESGRVDELGKHRLRLRGVQRPQGRPNSQAGPRGTDSSAGQAEAQPALEPQADATEVPLLAGVPRDGLLGSGVEVTKKPIRASGGLYCFHSLSNESIQRTNSSNVV